MGTTPTKRSYLKWDNNDGADYLQITNPSGAIVGWIDNAGTVQGSLLLQQVQTLTATGPVTIKNGLVFLDSSTAIQATLPFVFAGTTDDFSRLTIIVKTPSAGVHQVSPFQLGSGTNAWNFTSNLRSSFRVVAYGGLWYADGATGGYTTGAPAV